MTDKSLPEKSFGAFLFDMDGTVLTSILAAERVWAKWALKHGVDTQSLFAMMHGKRASETIAALNRPDLDAQAEAHDILLAEIEDVDGIVAISGAPSFLASLPADRWAIVTSAPRELARVRLAAAGLPLPPMMIAGEDVVHGKPSPEGFLRAAAQLGQKPEDCLIFEDAPAGIQAAEASGATVIVITETHSHPVETTHRTVPDYSALSPRVDASGRISITGGF